jgi:hypothetical protein
MGGWWAWKDWKDSNLRPTDYEFWAYNKPQNLTEYTGNKIRKLFKNSYS